ncbi:hemerythrin domain-containing protein [Streptomyces sp. NPDC051322]|uniref:hemerythrin domain-containing protein n=1 Tax=Streptomyces sp. NPDC051322 TaxID=3154645 RepID=UPI00344B7EA9
MRITPLLTEDVVDVLERQHSQIRGAFAKAALPGPGRRKAFENLVRLLAVHEAAEEAHVHPKAHRALAMGSAVTARRRREEKEAKELLTALWRTGPDCKGYLRKLTRLAAAVQRHAAREEREEFAALRQAVSARRLRLLAAEVRLTQLYAPTRPHRWVNNELTNKLAGPLFGPLDRGLDVARHLRAQLSGTG